MRNYFIKKVICCQAWGRKIFTACLFASLDEKMLKFANYIDRRGMYDYNVFRR